MVANGKAELPRSFNLLFGAPVKKRPCTGNRVHSPKLRTSELPSPKKSRAKAELVAGDRSGGNTFAVGTGNKWAEADVEASLLKVSSFRRISLLAVDTISGGSGWDAKLSA